MDFARDTQVHCSHATDLEHVPPLFRPPTDPNRSNHLQRNDPHGVRYLQRSCTAPPSQQQLEVYFTSLVRARFWRGIPLPPCPRPGITIVDEIRKMMGRSCEESSSSLLLGCSRSTDRARLIPLSPPMARSKWSTSFLIESSGRPGLPKCPRCGTCHVRCINSTLKEV